MVREFIRKYLRIILPVLVLLAVLTMSMPRRGEFPYSYSRGQKWNYETLIAPFSFPILKTEEQISVEKEKLKSTFVPYYNYLPGESAEVFESIIDLYRGGDEIFGMELCNALAPFYERGVLPEVKAGVIDLTSEVNGDIVFVQKGKHAIKIPVAELFTVEQVHQQVVANLKMVYPQQNVDSLIASVAALNCVRPNLVFDRQTTQLAHQQSTDYISPTSGMFQAGDVIVSAGEIITADLEQILDSYRAEFEENIGYSGPKFTLWVSNFLIAVILIAMLLCLIFFSRPDIFSKPNEFMFVLTVYLLACVASFVFSHFPSDYLYLVPFPVFALYFMAFFRKRFVLPLYVLCLLPILVFCDNSILMFVAHLAGGFAGILSFMRYHSGWRQFITSMVIFATMLTVYLSFRIQVGNMLLFDFYDVLYIFIGSVLCVFTYPLIFLFEIIFSLVSANRLMEMTDANNPMLRQLADKAPGTFQHSLSVMNMVDAVGRAVDADILLLRAAALYHDVGKIANPQCFVENQLGGVDYHHDRTPVESATDIIRHVSDGLEIATHHGIPEIVREFIASHHGTTSTGYFYNKYLNDGGDPSKASAFFYPGPKPRTKEQVILMLCDSIEAASRSLKSFSAESVSDLIEKIYKDKFDEGQYDDADITLSELVTVRQVLKEYIMQFYHGRVAYPKRRIL